MARTPAASIKRLQTLEAPSTAEARPYMVTREMSLSDWEAVATRQQAELLAFCAQDRQDTEQPK